MYKWYLYCKVYVSNLEDGLLWIIVKYDFCSYFI